MSSRRHTVIAAFAALVAAFVGTLPATAAADTGIGGYVTDAETGLPVSSATVHWSGPGGDFPATTPASGRFLFAGLAPGTAGSLNVTAPAGWDSVVAGPFTIPDGSVLMQEVPLHRDWATPAGGASLSATPDGPSANAETCASAAAADTNRATGWSAAAGSADSPAALTIALPQAIEVRQVVLNAAAVCGHDGGAALGDYRLETTTDGTNWTTAAEGHLAEADRGKDTVVQPTAGTAGVKQVRLVLLSPQDAASSTIDVREVAVYGVLPNTPPSGSVETPPGKIYVHVPVILRSSFTDADSRIVRYLWDFDGDGTWDQATLGPSVTHVWAGRGLYHVIVGARDFRGDLGTASLDLPVVDPTVPVEPLIQRKPLITFDPPRGIDLDARIACTSVCKFQVKYRVTRHLAKRLHLKHRTLRTWHKKTEGAGALGSWTFTLPHKTIKRLRRHHYRKVNVRVIAKAVDQQHRHATVRRWFTFR